MGQEAEPIAETPTAALKKKAWILVVDSDPIAIHAMTGILTRGGHHCIGVETAFEAWKVLRGEQSIDLVFIELDLRGEGGLGFIQQVRGDCYLKHVPLVVYTSVVQRVIVQKVLGLKVQNFLIKPYVDESVFREVTKAETVGWLSLLFADPDTFSKSTGSSVGDLRIAQTDLLVAIERDLQVLVAGEQGDAQIRKLLLALIQMAEGAGATAIEQNLKEIFGKSDHLTVTFLEHLQDDLAFAARLLRRWLHPKKKEPPQQSEISEKTREESATFLKWFTLDLSQGPLMPLERVIENVEALKGCPVISANAAAFQMNVGKSSISLTQLIDMVSKDGALAATVLGAAGHLNSGHLGVIEDPAQAVSLLGGLRLSAIAKDNPTIEERFMEVPPMSWEGYWTFQVAVSRFAAFACRQLEFKALASVAQTAGLVHDIGQLIMVKLFPFGIPAMMEYARKKGVSLATAERAFVGMDSREMGHRFAKSVGLSKRLCNTIAWAGDPAKATEDVELVAIVALARHVCIVNKVGSSGDPHPAMVTSIELSDAWGVLSAHVFPSFDLKLFKHEAKAFCAELRQTLAGRGE